MRIGVPVLWFNAVLRELVKEETFYKNFNYSLPTLNAIEAGFNHVEIVMNMYYLLPNSKGHFTKEVINKLKSIKEIYNITYSIHLPFWSVDPSSHIEKIRRTSVDVLKSSVDIADELKPTTFVLHATGALAADIYGQRMEKEQKKACIKIFSENSKKSVSQLVEHLVCMGISSRRLALESVKFPFYHSLELAKEFNTSICIDAGHILAGYPGDVSLKEAMLLSSGRIAEIHIHDVYRNIEGNKTIVKDHLPLGTGCLNLKEFFNLIATTRFDGPLILELKFEDACISLEQLKTVITLPIR